MIFFSKVESKCFLFSFVAKTRDAMTLKLCGESNNTLAHVAKESGVCNYPRKKYSLPNKTLTEV